LGGCLVDRSCSLLIVDDETDNFDVIEVLLFKEGYDLQYATGGQAALALLETLRPDVILLDVMMPDLDGLEVCRRIRANPDLKHIPVIMVTALSAKTDLALCLEAGANDFVSKPVNGVELRARVRSMLRIKQQYDALQSALRLRQDLASMVVHDLRNPLTQIMFAGEILGMSALQADQQAKLDQILTAGHRLNSLIDSILFIAKLEADKPVLSVSRVDLSKIAAQVVEEFQPIAAQKPIEIHINVPQTPCLTQVDVNLFHRIFDNLLSNAVKFAPAKSQVWVRVERTAEGGIQIQVQDHGQGISPEMRQRIFDRYEVGELMADVPQIGLGLAFCKMAIEAHGGTISVSQNAGGGATFTLTVPAERNCAIDSAA